MVKSVGFALLVLSIAGVMLGGVGYLLGISRPGALPALAQPVQDAPDVVRVDPAVVVNTGDTPVSVLGTNFTVTLSGGQIISWPTILLDGAPLSGVGWVSSATLTATVPAGYPVGIYDVTVQNPDGLSDTLASGLVVRHPTPQVTALDPVSGTYGQPLTLVITGADFVSPTTALLGFTDALDVVFVSSTTLTATLPSALVPGVYDLTVQNPGPGDVSDWVDDAFTLYSPIPTVSDIWPRKTYNDMDTPVVITGTNFAPTPQVHLGGMPLEAVTWVSLTQLTAQIPWGMTPGTYTLTVTNPAPRACAPGACTVALTEAITMTEGFNTWSTGGPYGGHVQELLMHPLDATKLYAVMMNVGIFASTDAGASWEIILREDWLTHMAFDAVDPEVIYVGGDGGLLRTLDGGEIWEDITPNIGTWTPSWNLYRPAGHPTQANVVYAGKRTPDEPDAEPGGLYRSGDNGTTWTLWSGESGGLTDTHVIDLAFRPGDPGTMVLGTQSGNVFASTNGGENWTWQAHVEPRIERIIYNPFDTDEVWILTSPPQSSWETPYVYTSTTLTTWTPVTITDSGGGSQSVYDLVFLSSDTIWAAMGYGVVSTDGGATWSDAGWAGFRAEDGVTAYAIDPDVPDVVYAGYNIGGVARSTDGGATWQAANEGLAGVIPWSLAISPDDPDLLYAYTTQGLLKSENGGRAWQSLDMWVGGRGGPYMVAVDPFTATRVYLGQQCVDALCLNISEDAGDTWRQISTTPSGMQGYDVNVNAVAPHPLVAGRIFAGVTLYPLGAEVEAGLNGGLFVSEDYGETWRYHPEASASFSKVTQIVYDAVNPALIYLGTSGSGLWRSKSGGTAWEPLNVPGLAPPIGVSSMATHPDRTGVILARLTSLAGTTNAGGNLYLSQDAGASWIQLDENTSDFGLVFAPPAPEMGPYMLYKGCGRGACRSMDTGRSWQTIYGVPRPTAMVAGTDGARIVIYAASPGGMAAAEDEARVLLSLGSTATIPGAGSLMGSGVYRTTMRPLDQRVYLPLVLR